MEPVPNTTHCPQCGTIIPLSPQAKPTCPQCTYTIPLHETQQLLAIDAQITELLKQKQNILQSTTPQYSSPPPPTLPPHTQPHTPPPTLHTKPNLLQNWLLGLGGTSVIIAILLMTIFLWNRTGDEGKLAIIFATIGALTIGGTKLLHSTRLRSTGSTLIILGYILTLTTFLYTLPSSISILQWWGEQENGAWFSPYPTLILSALTITAWLLAKKYESLAWLTNAIISGCLTIIFTYFTTVDYIQRLDYFRILAPLDAPQTSNPSWIIVSTIYVVIALAILKQKILTTQPHTTPPQPNKQPWAKKQKIAYIFYTIGLLLLALAALATINEITLTTIWSAWFLAILTIGATTFLLNKKPTPTTPTTTRNIIITTIAASGSWILLAPPIATNLPITLSVIIAASWGAAFLLLPPTLLRNKNLTLSNHIWGASTAWGLWLINSWIYDIEPTNPNYLIIIFSTILALSIYLLAWLPQPQPLAAWIAVLPATIATWEYITHTLTWETQQQPIEQYSIPLAILLAIAGYTWHTTSRNIYSPKLSSTTLLTIMPALLTALIPTSLSTWEFLTPNNTFPWIKTLTLLTIATLLILLGTRYKLGGLFYPGTAVLIIVLPTILWIAQEPIPRWVSFALIGATLIAIAAKLEWVKNQYTHWAQTFTQLK